MVHKTFSYSLILFSPNISDKDLQSHKKGLKIYESLSSNVFYIICIISLKLHSIVFRIVFACLESPKQKNGPLKLFA